MTQPHLLEQAKQGDPQAIAALMNKSLQPKGMTAYVDRQGDHLDVVLKADRIPNRQALTAFVEQGIQNLGIETIRSVTVSGQQLGATDSAWTEELDLNPLIPGFEPEATALTGAEADFESEFNSTFDHDATASVSDPSDLAQLQDLLSDQSQQDPQRQELENRLESLWMEQSQDQHQDFLSELMAEEPQDATRQFEEFLAEQPDDRFQSTEQEGLWNAPETDDLLADLNLEDSRDALTQQLQEPTYGWQQTDEPDDEPDEILFNFMEEQPQSPPDLGFDESGEAIDEPDEILPGFLETTGNSSLEDVPNPSNNLDLPESSDQATDQSFDFLSELPEYDTPNTAADSAADLGFSLEDDIASSDEDLLNSLGSDNPEQEDLLLELTGDRPDVDWNSNNSGQPGEFSADPSPDFMNELSLGVEEEPASSEIDFAAGTSPEASADVTSQDWEHPPIEFLQSELESSSLEMPTEQFDTPADLRTESSEDDSDRLADFPPDFLQEPAADQSHDLFVEPQANPFIEQMEEQDRERSQKPEDRPGEETNQFDQSEWLLEDNAPTSQSQGYENSQNLEDDDPLSDEALINFFEEDAELSGAGSQFPDDNSQFSEYRVRPDDPDTPSDSYASGSYTPDSYRSDPYSSDNSELVLDESTSLYDLGDRQDQEEALDLSLEPDQEFGRPASYDAEPASPASPYPEESFTDTQFPPYQAPSDEELERQVAELYPENQTVVQDPGTDLEPVSESRGSPWLFPLILLGISGWIVGLISFAFLWSRLSSPPPETAETTPADVAVSPSAAPAACPPTTQAVGNVPIALSELQFQQTPSNPQQINLTGCVTNRTQQAIDIVSIGYRTGTASAPTIGGLNFSTGIIQPGQTVPFTSRFALPSDTNNVSIGTVYWQPAGQTTSKEARTSVNLNR